MRRARMWSAIVLMVSCAVPVQANAGVPLIYLFVGQPVMWVALIAVVIIEMKYAQRIIGVTPRRALAISLIANLVSALFGIPVWLGIGPPNLYQAAFVVAILLIPAFFISVFSERWTTYLLVDRERRPAVRKWSWRANLTTYQLLMAVLLLLAAYDRYGPQ